MVNMPRNDRQTSIIFSLQITLQQVMLGLMLGLGLAARGLGLALCGLVNITDIDRWVFLWYDSNSRMFRNVI